MEQLKPDTIIDEKYRVIDILGIGGMGIVYRVEQLSLNSERALKTIPTDKLSDSVWQRFQREAKAACRLEHSSLVKVFDFGLLETVTPYYVMEIVQGQTLSARVKLKGTLTLEQCLSVFIPSAFGLAYAHDKKIIHRDMKPANIMFSEDTNGKITEVKILDFGIAKLISDENLTNALTKPGEVIGSPHFMSPEQSWGAKIDARSDIYSLGCCMFEALTGLPPFIAKNAVQVIMLHQNSPPPSLAQIAPDKTFSDSIEQVIRVMLAKNPDHRYQSMDDLAQDLIFIKNGKQPHFAQAQEKLSGQESNLATTNPKAKAIAPITLSLEKVVAKVTPKSLNADDTGGEISDNTFDQLSESQTVTTTIWKKFNYPALALATILLAGGIGTLFILRPNLPTYKIAKSSSNANPSSVSRDPLALSNQPFSRSSQLPTGQKVIVFDFPKEVSLGTIYSLNGEHVIEAQGEVTIPEGELIRFRPSRDFMKHTELFRKFKANQIGDLDLSNRLILTDEDLANIKHLVNIRRLDLSDSNVTPNCATCLYGMKNLTELNITNTDINDKALANLPALRHLEVLEARELGHLSNTLKAIAGSTRLHRLTLSNSAIDDNTVKLIGKDQNLEYLSLSENPGVTANGVKYLAPLKRLGHLNLLNCHVGPEVIETLTSFRQLHELKINTAKWSRDKIINLKASLPPGCKLDQGARTTKDNRDAFDHFKSLGTIGP